MSEIKSYKLQVCIETGKHNKSCDEDGYCNYCGEQWVEEDQ